MILTFGIAAALASGCVAVDGERILGSHLAQADAVFATLDPAVVIGFSPRPGAVRNFATGELTRIAVRFGLSGRPATGACFERAAAPLDRGPMVAAMRDAIGNPDARIEIVEYSSFVLPRGPLHFPVDGLSLPAMAGPGQGIARWRGFVQDADGRKYSIWARVRVSVSIDQVIAMETLKPGEPVGAAQLRLEKRDAFPFRRTSIGRIEDALGRRPRYRVAEGAVVDDAMLEPRHDVERGASVETEVHRGAVVLKLDAIAETSGSRGDIVIVKNPSSGKKFSARVEGKNKVVVRGS